MLVTLLYDHIKTYPGNDVLYFPYIFHIFLSSLMQFLKCILYQHLHTKTSFYNKRIGVHFPLRNTYLKVSSPNPLLQRCACYTLGATQSFVLVNLKWKLWSHLKLINYNLGSLQQHRQQIIVYPWIMYLHLYPAVIRGIKYANAPICVKILLCIYTFVCVHECTYGNEEQHRMCSLFEGILLQDIMYNDRTHKINKIINLNVYKLSVCPEWHRLQKCQSWLCRPLQHKINCM